MDWTDFYKSVLPEDTDGVYCIVRGQNKLDRQQFCTFDELVNLTNQVEATSAPLNKNNEYFCAASLTPDPNGNKRDFAHAKGSKVLIFDIDVRPNSVTHYNDKASALNALINLVSAHKLPMPSYLIDSGRGFHVYWALDRVLTPAQHAQLGDAVAAHLELIDPLLAADTSVTKNTVGIIRMPGSWNHRVDPPVKVQLLPFPNQGQVVKMDDFIALTGALYEKAGMVAPTNVFSGVSGRIISDVVPLEQAEDLFTGCAVLRHIRDSQHYMNGGSNLYGYEVWRLAMALLSRATDFENAAHEFSALSPVYSYDLTQKQIRTEIKNNATMAAPIRCDTLCDELKVGPSLLLKDKRELCKGCKFYKPQGGDSPYRAGVEVETLRRVNSKPQSLPPPVVVTQPVPTPQNIPLHLQPATGDDEYTANLKRRTACLLGHTFEPIDFMGIELDKSIVGGNDYPFTMNPLTGSLMYQPPDEEDEAGNSVRPPQVRAATAIFWPYRYIFDPHTRQHKIQIVIVQKKEGAYVGKYATLDSRSLGTRADVFLENLMANQVIVSSDRKVVNALLHWFNGRLAGIETGNVMTAFDQFGWTEDKDAFILGNLKFTSKGEIMPTFLDRKLESLSKQHFEMKGNVNSASEVLRYIEAHGSDVAKMVVMLSAGTPMSYMGEFIGGYVNLFGLPNLGKTLLLTVASFLWGSGERGRSTGTSAKDTVNARYAQLEAFNSIPLTFDEATGLHATINLPGEENKIGTLLYEITDGRGKARVDRDGSRKDVTLFSTMVIASSNNSLRRICTVQSVPTAAQLQRAFEIEIDEPVMTGATDEERSTRMREVGMAIGASGGTIGIRLARHYAMNRAALESEASALIGMLKQGGICRDRTPTTIAMLALLGGRVLAREGLWSMSDMDMGGVVARVLAREAQMVGGLASDPRRTLAEALHSLQPSMAVVHHPAGGQAGQGSNVVSMVRSTNQAANSGPIVRKHPDRDYHMRIDEFPAQRMVRFSIKVQELDRVLSRYRTTLVYIEDTLREAGIKFSREDVNLHADGVGVTGRDGVTQVSSISVPCFVIEVDENMVNVNAGSVQGQSNGDRLLTFRAKS